MSRGDDAAVRDDGRATTGAVHSSRQADAADGPVLSVDSLSVEYATDRGPLEALRDVSIEIRRGETLGIAGESGSGKSTLALAIMRYLGGNGTVTDGSIRFDGESLLAAGPKRLRSIRGNHIAHVPQDPKKSLNPSIRVGEQIAETIRLHQGVGDEEATRQVHELLERLDISDPAYNADRYPHELSGGMQQRVLFAIALSCDPELLILDEPTTGLDVTTQAKILDIIEQLKREADASILLITHDLGVIAETAERVSILYAGEQMETGPVETVFDASAHPYTQGLLAATPEIDHRKKLTPIPGSVASLTDVPEGCIFADRCAFATEECRSAPIAEEPVDGSRDHTVRCRRWETARADPIEAAEAEAGDHQTGEAVVAVENLRKHFGQPGLIERYFGEFRPTRAVDGLSFTVHESETLAIVGESGCGKSTLGKCLVRLLEPTDGTISFRGTPLGEFDESDLDEFHAEVGIVFQNPDSSLNPRKTVYETVSRPLRLFTDMGEAARKERTLEVLEEVGLGAEYAGRYPHELSGGEKQRVGIARSFVSNPSFVVLDEPVSALDVSVQASILDLLASLRAEYGTSYLLISHDLSVVNYIADRIGVMYLGKLVELGSKTDVFEPPYHPYTRVLLSSVPSTDPGTDRTRLHLEGDVPSARNPPSGCRFHTRCPQFIGDVCVDEEPELEATDDAGDHCVACHLEEDAMSIPDELVGE